MNEDLLTIALRMASEFLDTEKRAWILGIANLVDQPLDTPPLPDDEVRGIFEIASETVEFPSGPLSYSASGYDVDLLSHHRLVTLRGGEFAPHLEMQFGLGEGGFIAVALTRSDVFDDGSRHVGGIPLADLESVIADTYVLAVGASLATAYSGPIEFAFDIVDTRPDVQVTGFVIDDETGALEVAPVQEGFRMVTGSTLYGKHTSPRSAHADIQRYAASALAQFGALPQLTSLLEDSNEAYSSNPLRYEEEESVSVWNR